MSWFEGISAGLGNRRELPGAAVAEVADLGGTTWKTPPKGGARARAEVGDLGDKNRAARKFAAVTGLGLASLVALTGCFQPLYSETAHPGLAQAMKTVQVQPVDGRLGAYLTDDLVTQMNGTGETPTPKYRLKIAVPKPSVTTPTVESQIAFASSATMTASVEIVLTAVEDGKVVYHGEATAIAPYDRSFDNYANLRASRDAELRIARSLADEIAQRVAAAISTTM